jgi:putative membrane protein
MSKRAAACGALGAVAVGLYLLYPAAAQQQRSAERARGTSDQTFVTKAVLGGLEEVSLGKLAMQQASSPDVKRFGKRMVDDHTKANEELLAIADKKGFKVPQQMSAKAQQEITRMAGFQGQNFDQMYMKSMVKDHKKDIEEFENQAKNGRDPDVKAFAEKTLPTIREHLKLAEEVNAKVNSGASR